MYFHFFPRGGADQLGKYMISALVAFVLVSLFNAYRMKKSDRAASVPAGPKAPGRKPLC